MGHSDWADLEVLGRKIADVQGRLARARSTQNHGLVQVLEKEIAVSEGMRDHLVSHIATQLTSSDQGSVRRDATSTEPASASPQPPPTAEPTEGVDTVWNQLNRADLERVKGGFEARRSEMLARHAEELRALEAEKAEIEVVEQAIVTLVRKFNIGSAEVLPLERPAFSHAG